MPDCQAGDDWVTVAEFDNSASSLISTFTYTYTIDTAWSQQMSEVTRPVSIRLREHLLQGFSVSAGVEVELQAAFWSLFSGGLGGSSSTGYNWGEVSSQAQQETQQYQVVTSAVTGVINADMDMAFGWLSLTSSSF